MFFWCYVKIKTGVSRICTQRTPVSYPSTPLRSKPHENFSKKQKTHTKARVIHSPNAAFNIYRNFPKIPGFAEQFSYKRNRSAKPHENFSKKQKTHPKVRVIHSSVKAFNIYRNFPKNPRFGPPIYKKCSSNPAREKKFKNSQSPFCCPQLFQKIFS
jgi:hypothetical protein